MHPTTRASGQEHPIPCGGVVCGVLGPGCGSARGIARLLGEMGMVGWSPRPGWSCERAEASLLFLSRLKPPGRPSLDGSAGASPQLVVRVSSALRARAARAASARGTSMAALVRAALERHLDVVEDEPAAAPGRPAPEPAVLLTTARSRASIEEVEPFDAAAAYAEADAADRSPAPEASRGHDPPRPIP